MGREAIDDLLVRALRLGGPRVRGWFPVVVERVATAARLPRGVRRAEVLGSELELDLGEYMQRRFFYHCYEGPAVAFFRRWLRRGDAVADVGAHVGLFTTHAARLVGPSGRVHAFEPVPATHAALARNVALNGYDHVDVRRAAVGDATGEVRLGLPEERLVGYSTSDYTVGGELGAVSAPAVRPDDVLADAARLRLLKIDAEGFEAQILAGASRLLAERPPEAIMLEVNVTMLSAHGASAGDVLGRLDHAGYRTFRMGERGAPAPAPDLERMRDAARRWSARREPRSKILVGLGTRDIMFNGVAIHRTALD